MVDVLDQIRSEDVSENSRPWDAVEKELVCGNYRDAITEEFKKLNYGIEADVSFETDGYKIHQEMSAILNTYNLFW